ncbi:MAG: DUF1273 domain-containing protein [Ruminococcaceae bacterium]|nr:DUF1273 domain-containing protein [Oscillospiraceae bacterium]
MYCVFFGHRNTPESIRPVLKETLINLIKSGITFFYVGHQGNFDKMVREELQCLKTCYPKIEYYIVLAYPEHDFDTESTIYPEGLESVPRRFAVDKRNRWMVSKADTAVVYIIRPGGANKYTEMLLKQKKKIINLATKL